MQYSQKYKGSIFDKFSPDSQYYCNFEGQKLYIKESSNQGKNLSIINNPFHPTLPQEIIFSPDSQYIAFLIKKNNTILIYKIVDGKLVAKIQDNQAGIVNFLWCQDSSQIITFSQNNFKCSIYLLYNNSIQYIKNPKLSGNKGCSFTKDGKFMALLQRHDSKDFLNVYHTQSWSMVNSFQLNELFDTVQITWSPNDSYILAWDNCINYRLLVFCPLKGFVKKYQPYNYALGIKCLKFSNKCNYLTIGSFDQKIRLLNPLTWNFIGQLDCSLTTIGTNDIKIYKQEDEKNGDKVKLLQSGMNYKIPCMKINHSSDKGPNQGVCMIQISPDDKYIACKNQNMPYSVFIFNGSSLKLVSLISFNNHVKMFKWTNNNNEKERQSMQELNNLCIVTGTDRLVFWRQDSLIQSDFKFENGLFNIQKIKFSDDGQKMLMMDKNGMQVFAEFDSNKYDGQDSYE